ncbi:MAG: hypothetical protein JSV66_13755 [Trueperaceae bacterium]|nr:MAG: hypothetical protein JSV66_13755 [Trueperaceae bacterium]
MMYGNDAVLAYWHCTSCDHTNSEIRVTCDLCGLARRHIEDPLIDIPHPPRFTHHPRFLLFCVWAGLGFVGLALLSKPAWRETLGIGAPFLILEMLAAYLSAADNVVAVIWDRWFNQIELEVPEKAATGKRFGAAIKLVPYRRIERIRISMCLIDRYFERPGSDQPSTRKVHRIACHELPVGRPLKGRREYVLRENFIAPFPITSHHDIGAEITASFLALFAWLIPSLGLMARNLREHGGYYLRVKIQVGLLSRTIERRVLVYHLGYDLFVG